MTFMSIWQLSVGSEPLKVVATAPVLAIVADSVGEESVEDTRVVRSLTTLRIAMPRLLAVALMLTLMGVLQVALKIPRHRKAEVAYVIEQLIWLAVEAAH